MEYQIVLSKLLEYIISLSKPHRLLKNTRFKDLLIVQLGFQLFLPIPKFTAVSFSFI